GGLPGLRSPDGAGQRAPAVARGRLVPDAQPFSPRLHLVLWPHGDGDLGRWMQWLLTAHVRRYHRHYGGSGHVWQGRFTAFPIQEDEHLLAVLRYVERNALRANRSAAPRTGRTAASLCPATTGRH